MSKLCFPAYFWNIWKERNHRIIRSTSRPWEVVPGDVFKQIKTRESFLNLVTSSALAAEWDLPPYPRMNFSTVYIKRVLMIFGNFFFALKMGYWWASQSQVEKKIIWTKTVYQVDSFSGAAILIGEATKESSLCIFVDSKRARNTLIGPSTSPWIHRFQARKAACLVVARQSFCRSLSADNQC